MKKKILLILSLFTFISPILFAQAPDSMVGKKLSLNFNVPENDAIGVHEFFLTDSVTSIGNYFKTSNDSSDNPYWLTELYNYKKSDTTNGTVRIISSDGGWVDIVLTFSSSTSASSTISGYAKNGTLEWNGTGDVTMTNLAISEISTSYQPNVLTSNFAPTSIAAGSLSAQDKYWPVYDETITFSTSGTFNANITNGSDNPTGSGNYTYTYTGTNSATLSYSIDGAGISFEYALQFTGANTGIYTKYADYGGGNTDITTGPFALTGISVPEQFAWEDYDDFNDNSLDVSKWESTNSYFVGNQPTETNGRIELTGLNSQNSQKNTFLILKDLDDLVGVEADIWLPSNAPVDTGVLIGISDAGTPVGYIDLWADSEQTKIYINLGNSATGEAIDFTRNAELGKSYKVAIIKGEQKTALYLDGEKVAEVSTWQSNNLDIIFRGVNDAGSSFTAYLDNVRVLRNWVDYDDFSGSSLDTSKWGTMNFYGGDKPEVKDGRVEFSSSGKSVSVTSDFKQGWNSTEFINYTEGAPGSVLYVNDSTVYGMEASVTLPVGSSPKTAICLQVGSLNPFGQHIAELMNDSGNGAGFWIHDYVADTGVSTSASSATTFQVAVIHENEKNTFYINSKKVHELDASNFTPDWFGINTFENDGKAYTVYADNIRVLKVSGGAGQSEDGDLTSVGDYNLSLKYNPKLLTSETLTSVDLDGLGNAYVSGWHMISGMRRLFVAKFDFAGDPVWNYQFEAFAGEAGKVKFAPDGSTYFTGMTLTEKVGNQQSHLNNFQGKADAFLAKFDQLGNLEWFRFIGGPDYENVDFSKVDGLEVEKQDSDIIILPDGNIVVSGSSDSGTEWLSGGYMADLTIPTGVSFDWVAQISPSGEMLWSSSAGASNGGNGIKLSADLSGYIYLTAETFGNLVIADKLIIDDSYEGNDDNYLVKIDPAIPQIVWARHIGGPGDEEDGRIATGDDGVYILMSTDRPINDLVPTSEQSLIKGTPSSLGEWNAILLKFSFNGSLTWGTWLDGGGKDSLVVTKQGEAWVLRGVDNKSTEWPSNYLFGTGTNPPSQIADFILSNLDSNGDITKEWRFGIPAASFEKQVQADGDMKITFYQSIAYDNSTKQILLGGTMLENDFNNQNFPSNESGVAGYLASFSLVDNHLTNRWLSYPTENQTPLLAKSADPVTVVSGPNGQAIVTQVGNEYKWNSTLDGVTLWGVWNDKDKGWTGATIQYVSGKQKGSIGLTDQVGTNLEVNHPYVVDENGTMKVTENTAYQYYQITSVQNGVIETKDGSTLPLSDTSKFFTTRAAAEEYYYSKANPKDWMWFDHYPWVYSNEMQEWLYFYPSGSKLLYYSNKNQAWREFSQ